MKRDSLCWGPLSLHTTRGLQQVDSRCNASTPQPGLSHLKERFHSVALSWTGLLQVSGERWRVLEQRVRDGGGGTWRSVLARVERDNEGQTETCWMTKDMKWWRAEGGLGSDTGDVMDELSSGPDHDLWRGGREDLAQILGHFLEDRWVLRERPGCRLTPGSLLVIWHRGTLGDWRGARESGGEEEDVRTDKTTESPEACVHVPDGAPSSRRLLTLHPSLQPVGSSRRHEGDAVAGDRPGRSRPRSSGKIMSSHRPEIGPLLSSSRPLVLLSSPPLVLSSSRPLLRSPQTMLQTTDHSRESQP
ncbi:unnamed protein product [Pleuronectes platessa]|uniref:Uncharacterized protein n=1 Tax=Pleuronectes platessa TaxID=8262 RepID=A0A9N7U803_PLEPL|nr:unnamed protein product [Pleuronectes platessa]